MTTVGRLLHRIPLMNIFTRHLSQKAADGSIDQTKVTEKSEKVSKAPAKRYNYYTEGGDLNLVKLVGTVYKLDTRIRENERMMATIVLRTIRSHIDRGYPEVMMTYHRVQVFAQTMVTRASRLKVGDRLYVQGFLSYYKLISEPNSKIKVGCIVPQKLITMGVGPDIDDYLSIEGFDDDADEEEEFDNKEYYNDDDDDDDVDKKVT